MILELLFIRPLPVGKRAFIYAIFTSFSKTVGLVMTSPSYFLSWHFELFLMFFTNDTFPHEKLFKESQFEFLLILARNDTVLHEALLNDRQNGFSPVD